MKTTSKRLPEPENIRLASIGTKGQYEVTIDRESTGWFVIHMTDGTWRVAHEAFFLRRSYPSQQAAAQVAINRIRR